MIYVYRYLLAAVSTVFWASLAIVTAPFDRSGESMVWMARNWIRWILGGCNIRVEVEGLEHIDPKQPYVVMTNHQSVIDIGAIIQTLPISFRFVAKKELTWIPIFGWGLALARRIRFRLSWDRQAPSLYTRTESPNYPFRQAANYRNLKNSLSRLNGAQGGNYRNRNRKEKQ